MSTSRDATTERSSTTEGATTSRSFLAEPVSHDEMEAVNQLIRASLSGNGANTFRERRASQDECGTHRKKKDVRTEEDVRKAKETANINELIVRKSVERAQREASAERAAAYARAQREAAKPPQSPTHTATALHFNLPFAPSPNLPAASPQLTPACSPSSSDSVGDAPPHTLLGEAVLDQAPKSLAVKERAPRESSRRSKSKNEDLVESIQRPDVLSGYNNRGTLRATRRIKLLLHMRNREGDTRRKRVHT